MTLLAGPIVAEAIFLNREELPVVPIYFDPVHDFAFLRFDPTKLQFMEIGEVPLAPEAASVGLDIRVVGNDSGEKVGAHAGIHAHHASPAKPYLVMAHASAHGASEFRNHMDLCIC